MQEPDCSTGPCDLEFPTAIRNTMEYRRYSRQHPPKKNSRPDRRRATFVRSRSATRRRSHHRQIGQPTARPIRPRLYYFRPRDHRAVSARSPSENSVSLTTASSWKRAIRSPRSMASLRSIDPHGIRASEIDALNAGRGGEPRDILRQRTALTTSCRYRGDPVGHEFERQSATFVLAVKPDDVETVACCDRLRSRSSPAREQTKPARTRVLSGRR